MTPAIVFGRGGLEQFSSLFALPSGRPFLVSSPTVMGFHGAAIREALAPRTVLEISMDDREETKSLDTLRAILDQAIGLEVCREDFIISFGGGVVSDVAGLAAALLLRGIRWFAVPTTVLAMADAAIGGKTAVNHPLGKNLIGAFHSPQGVLVDPDVLGTLPDRHFRSGLVEIMKTALVADGGMAERMMGHMEEIAVGRRADDLTQRAAQIKQEIVSRDPLETGERRILNFGHTLGHALEAAGNFHNLSHGEAVAIGMATALAISVNRRIFPAGRAEAIGRELIEFAGRERLAGIDPEDPRIREALARDKKNLVASRPAVLLEGVGRPAVVDVSLDEWKEALAGVLATFAI